MGLEIRQREREGILILDLKGRITAGEEAAHLRETLRALAAEGKTRVILNLEDVDYIDSTGLGTLVMGFTTLRKAGGSLKLLRLSRRNIELLVFTKLETVFEIFDDELDALNSFFPGRAVRRFDILSFVQQMEREGRE
ncbi:MAG: STAS domain-containing protein [Bryobacterales bacterium]|nr:STAS domain-containing protein [Bryobacteraceae bacterium]MDW8131233.1 STAS domain-containing protein [Bryobacterales bacterium]